jgi:hypothetical protein
MGSLLVLPVLAAAMLMPGLVVVLVVMLLLLLLLLLLGAHGCPISHLVCTKPHYAHNPLIFTRGCRRRRRMGML